MPSPPTGGSLPPDESERVVAHLILRQLYDGDVIDYPIAEDHPHRPVFERLVSGGLIARWDRAWPLRDRYRLTELGIAEVERQYKPAEGEAVYRELRRLAETQPDADPAAALRARGLDPLLWPVLHDPYTHWSTWTEHDPGPYSRTVWRSRPWRRSSTSSEKPAPAGPEPPPMLVDLDREAGAMPPGTPPAEALDVS